MDMMTAENKAAKEFFTWLGKFDWLKVEDQPNGKYKTGPCLPDGIFNQPLGQWFAEMCLDTRLTSSDYYTFYLWSKHLAQGPKTFRPSMEQCLVMEQMEINLPTSEYQQAFDVVKIEWPTEYREYILRKHQFKCPHAFLCNKFKNGGIIMVSVDPDLDMGDYVKLISPDAESIEKEIVDRSIINGLVGLEKQEWVMAEDLLRLAINLNLLLCHFPTTLDLQDKKREKELKRQMTVPNRSARKTAAAEWENQPKIISFVQHVQLYDVEPGKSSSSHPHGTPKPHWRKGHWRRQRFGEKLAQIKRVFIRPVLVNESQFVGNTGDTSVTYYGEK